MIQILLVEDDANLQRLIHDFLSRHHYNIHISNDGEQALHILETQHIDVVITDIMMPKLDGFELTKELRAYNKKLPIIMITAKEDFEDKKQGFLIGADDYLVKPINLDELLFRLKAILRRAQIANDHQITIGSLVFNAQHFNIETPNEIINLPKKEFELLFKLLSYPKQIFTRQQLFDEIWGSDVESDLRTIDVHIKRLRDKLINYNEIKIITVRGLGYKVEKYE